MSDFKAKLHPVWFSMTLPGSL